MALALLGICLTLVFPWQRWTESTGKPKERPQRPSTGDAYKDWLADMSLGANKSDSEYMEHFVWKIGMRGYWLAGPESAIVWPRVGIQAGIVALAGLIGMTLAPKKSAGTDLEARTGA